MHAQRGAGGGAAALRGIGTGGSTRNVAIGALRAGPAEPAVFLNRRRNLCTNPWGPLRGFRKFPTCARSPRPPGNADARSAVA